MKTMEQLKAEFLKSVGEALEDACDKAYSKLTNDTETWAESDIEANMVHKTKEGIESLLAGNDTHWIKVHTANYNYGHYVKIRELMWKENADELTKRIIESKDEEIKRLKQVISNLARS